jgi:methionyl-tRNA synthetase
LWADEFLASEDPELVRLYLSWDRPDRYESDFTDRAYRAFGEWVRPLLDVSAPAGGELPPALAEAELERSEQALRLTGFDAALSVRSMLAALGAGVGRDSVALAALAGRGPRPPAEGR